MTYYQHSYVRDTSLRRKMIVEGLGHLTVAPDHVIIRIGVSTEQLNVSDAQAENSLLSKQLLEALKELEIKDHDIETVVYTIQPIYEYVDGNSILKGYQVQHIYEVTVRDLQKISTVYGIAVSSGANLSGDIRFDVSNLDAYYQQALQLAMKNATEKALKLGNEMGVTILHPPLNVKEESLETLPRGMVSFADAVSLQGNPPIQNQQIEIKAKLSVVFLY